MELGKENIDNDNANFLDMNISIIHNKFDVKLYDKRDNFNFNIVRMPNKSSNIPARMFYNSISAESLRILHVSSTALNFATAIKPLIQRMENQGAKKHKLKTTLAKSFKKHFDEYSKIAPTIESFDSIIFNN